MEILSTGEKIKRARIYKGYTLKDICGDEVSVSKMSCIENGKIEAEDKILTYLCEKLEIDIKYLKEGVRDQLLLNIKKTEQAKKDEKYEEQLQYNLNFANQYEEYDHAFNIMHSLFEYYLGLGKLERLQLLVSNYHSVTQKTNDEEKLCVYYMDISKYFFMAEEYIQAINYFSNVRVLAKKINNMDILLRATYNEAASKVMNKDYKEAYETSIELLEIIDFYKDDLSKAEAYHLIAMLNLRMGSDEFSIYEEKAFKLYGDMVKYKAIAMYNFAIVMFDSGELQKALSYIKKSLDIYPLSENAHSINLTLLIVKELIKNKMFNEAQNLSNDVLDCAIKFGDNQYIERAYYFKAMILISNEDYFSAEMYMSLSLDSLIKCGSKRAIAKRYTEMGSMYHKMGHTAEALDYYNSAMNIERQI